MKNLCLNLPLILSNYLASNRMLGKSKIQTLLSIVFMMMGVRLSKAVYAGRSILRTIFHDLPVKSMFLLQIEITKDRVDI